MATQIAGHIRAGDIDDPEAGRLPGGLRGGGHAIAVIYHDGRVYAVDNRCPHMGFPLDRGSVSGGILTLPLAPCPVRPGQRRHVQSLRR